ncbi:MAG: RNA polymerase sigma factor [Planctomycetaceae bacterium]
MLDDDQLMIAIQSGDSAAFDELVDRYERSLIGFFFHNLRDIQLAEDLTQETLLKVYHQAWDYLPLGSFKGWLFRIARNLMIDDIRKRSHDALIKAVKGSLPGEDDPLTRLVGRVAPPDAAIDGAELSGIIGELLGEIPEDQRLTFVLHHHSELPLAEVARIMEVTEPTTKSRLRLAREKLQEKLRVRGLAPSECET